MYIFRAPRGRWIFWVDSCQLGVVSTEDYSLTYRTLQPVCALLHMCVCVFPFFTAPPSFSPLVSSVVLFLFHSLFLSLFLSFPLFLFPRIKPPRRRVPPRQNRVIFLQTPGISGFSALAISITMVPRWLPSMIEFPSTFRNRSYVARIFALVD